MKGLMDKLKKLDDHLGKKIEAYKANAELEAKAGYALQASEYRVRAEVLSEVRKDIEVLLK